MLPPLMFIEPCVDEEVVEIMEETGANT